MKIIYFCLVCFILCGCDRSIDAGVTTNVNSEFYYGKVSSYSRDTGIGEKKNYYLSIYTEYIEPKIVSILLDKQAFVSLSEQLKIKGKENLSFIEISFNETLDCSHLTKEEMVICEFVDNQKNRRIISVKEKDFIFLLNNILQE